MTTIVRQFAAIAGAAIATACCLGVSAVLAAVGALGLEFLIHDAYLFPFFVGFVGVTLWFLYRSAREHGDPHPFWLGLAGGVISSAGLWLLVTGLYPLPMVIYLGLGGLVAGSVWDLINGRRRAACATEVVCEPTENGAKPQTNLGPKVAKGAALSMAAAAAFYGLYKSVDAFAPQVEEGTIACWGINSCKGTTACTTAFNACNGQNACKGRGFLYVSRTECEAQGGVPLEDSEGNPRKAKA